jgi:hypothetical protein
MSLAARPFLQLHERNHQLPGAGSAEGARGRSRARWSPQSCSTSLGGQRSDWCCGLFPARDRLADAGDRLLARGCLKSDVQDESPQGKRADRCRPGEQPGNADLLPHVSAGAHSRQLPFLRFVQSQPGLERAARAGSPNQHANAHSWVSRDPPQSVSLHMPGSPRLCDPRFGRTIPGHEPGEPPAVPSLAFVRRGPVPHGIRDGFSRLEACSRYEASG